MNKDTIENIVIGGTVIIVMLIFFIGMFYITQTSICKNYEQGYSIRTWSGNEFYLSSNFEEARKMAGDKFIISGKKCID